MAGEEAAQCLLPTAGRSDGVPSVPSRQASSICDVATAVRLTQWMLLPVMGRRAAEACSGSKSRVAGAVARADSKVCRDE
jgi:hypothetical protein